LIGKHTPADNRKRVASASGGIARLRSTGTGVDWTRGSDEPRAPAPLSARRTRRIGRTGRTSTGKRRPLSAGSWQGVGRGVEGRGGEQGSGAPAGRERKATGRSARRGACRPRAPAPPGQGERYSAAEPAAAKARPRRDAAYCHFTRPQPNRRQVGVSDRTRKIQYVAAQSGEDWRPLKRRARPEACSSGGG
jgi:hypothetical protein